MKKLLTALIALMLVVGMTGCKSVADKNFFGLVKGVVIGDDYEAAGRMVGNAGYMAYVVMRGDPKYDKYTSKAEEIYALLDNAEGFDTASVNKIFLEVMQAGLTAKYGFVKAALITDGIRIGGVIADRLFLKNVSTADANLYLKGIKEGIDEARAGTPLEALDQAAAERAAKLAEKENKKNAKYITCTEGVCEYDFSKMRGTSKQLALANELKNDGWLDYSEQPTETVLVTKADNVEHFIERTTVMKKFKVKTLRVWITYVKVNAATHKLVDIKFVLLEDDGTQIDVDCVGCVSDIELLDNPDYE